MPRKPEHRLWFRKIRDNAGLSSTGGATGNRPLIEVDLTSRWSNPLAVFVHEDLHLKHWSWSEERVERETVKLMREMTTENALYLFRHMLRQGVVIDDEDDD